MASVREEEAATGARGVWRSVSLLRCFSRRHVKARITLVLTTWRSRKPSYETVSFSYDRWSSVVLFFLLRFSGCWAWVPSCLSVRVKRAGPRSSPVENVWSYAYTACTGTTLPFIFISFYGPFISYFLVCTSLFRTFYLSLVFVSNFLFVFLIFLSSFLISSISPFFVYFFFILVLLYS